MTNEGRGPDRDDIVDETLSRDGDPPPDLDLSLAAFRRALAVL